MADLVGTKEIGPCLQKDQGLPLSFLYSNVLNHRFLTLLQYDPPPIQEKFTQSQLPKLNDIL